VWSTYGAGRYAVGEGDMVLLPSGFRQDGTVRGVVYCHGAGGGALSASDPVKSAGEWALVRGIAEHYPVVVADLGGPFTFGNARAVARVDDARRYLQDQWGAAPGPVGLVGASMGGVVALNYAATHRAQVLAAVGVVPVSDLHDLYARNAGGLTPRIAAAWDLTAGDPLPAGADPTRNAAELVGIPYDAWYAGDDTVVPASTVLRLVSLMGPAARARGVGRLGHTQAAIGAASVPDILGFLATHLA
jgi:pimeloyl-ACP methyl ester carboxylesterase